MFMNVYVLNTTGMCGIGHGGLFSGVLCQSVSLL